jgi:phage gp36-like protein
MAYATVDDLKRRFDVRTLGDLASDDGNQVASANLPSDANVLAALDDASGEIDSAVLVARRYAPADLAALTGNAAAHLKRLTCEIAMHLLIDRRLYTAASDYADRLHERTRTRLDDLRAGRRIFDTAGTADAGLPTNTGPTTGERKRQNYISERARGHIYPKLRLPDDR